MPEAMPYAQFPGRVIGAPPCRMQNANMYGFYVKGDIVNIQRYIDQTVGLVDGYTFKAISSYCMLSFTDIAQMRSLTPPWSDWGWTQETDVIVWLPVARMKSDKIEHLYWYPAFICVNSPYALVNGREIWGFNKYQCTCQMPGIGGAPDFFNMTVDAFKTFAPDSPMTTCELFKVERVQTVSENAIDNFFDLVKAGHELLQGTADFFAMDGALFKQLLANFIHPQVDQLLFKQLPNGDASLAVYQNVLHSPSLVKKVHSGRLYLHEFQFTLNQVDMFPLNEMFGIALGTQRPLLAFNMLFDFDQEAALAIE